MPYSAFHIVHNQSYPGHTGKIAYSIIDVPVGIDFQLSQFCYFTCVELYNASHFVRILYLEHTYMN